MLHVCGFNSLVRLAELERQCYFRANLDSHASRGGFNKIYYLLPYATTAAQGIPHDIKTMHELWGVTGYRRQNKYFSAAGLLDLIEQVEDEDTKNDLKARTANLLQKYNTLSDKYHAEKADNENNSLVLG